MLPLVDMHCHLVAGVDDGPRQLADAVAMCRISLEEGVGAIHGLAHQNDTYAEVTPEMIREGIARLNQELRQEELPLLVVPGAEVMVVPSMGECLERNQFLSIGDRKQYLFIEMPHGLYVDLRDCIWTLGQHGLRPILAHPEQVPELLFEPRRAEELIELGCLFQVSSANVVQSSSARSARALRQWFRRKMVHVLGSDGHSPRRRPPLMREAYLAIAQWVGESEADRVCSIHGMSILQGLPLKTPPITRDTWLGWLPRFWSSV